MKLRNPVRTNRADSQSRRLANATVDGEDPLAPRSPVLVVLAQAPSAACGLVGVYERTVPCHFCPYSPWSCSPSARSGTQARLEWHLRGTLVERCAQSRNFPRGGRTPMGPLPWAPMVRPTPPRRKVGEVRPNRGFVALSQVLRGAAAILWSCTPAHGGFILPPPPPSISWPLCTGPIAWSAVEGACCVCRGGPNQAPCPRTFLCLPRLSLLPVCLSLLSCLTGADPEWLRNVCAGR
jgi:hypothetical protein